VSDESTERIAELEQRIAELKARLPKHSTPVGMLIELDELDEALERARAEAAAGRSGPARWAGLGRTG
jgi:hypothetical protein